MALFKKEERNYGSIVAPLAKMRQDLMDYMEEQKGKIDTLIAERIAINNKISHSEDEISSSEMTAEKLSEMLGKKDTEA